MITVFAFATGLQGQRDAPPALLGPPPPQADLANLNAELAGLKVEAERLRQQLQQGAPGAVQNRATEVAIQIARVEGDIARVQAQIAGNQGTVVWGTVPPPVDRGPLNGVDPDMFAGMAFIVTLVFLIPLSIALARRLGRGGLKPAPTALAEIAPRLDRLEQAIDSIAIEVERISEGQRFVTKILADQPQIQASVTSGKPPFGADGNNL